MAARAARVSTQPITISTPVIFRLPSTRSGIPSQSNPQNRFKRLARTADLYNPISDRLTNTVRQGDRVWVKQHDVQAFRVAVYQQCLVQVGQTGGDYASVAAAAHNQYAYSVPQQLWVDLMRFHPSDSL